MAQDKEFYIKIGGLKESINDFDKLKKSVDDSKNSFDTQNKTVGDYSKALREANKEIKTIQGEMLGLEKGSKAWTELAKKAGEYKDRVDDIREATRRYASDTKGLDDVINLAQSATAAFTLYKGAMSAFGVETENAEKALTELAGAMSIIQSLQTLNNTLKGSSATASLFNTAMKVTGAQLVQTQLASIKATAAQEGLSTAQKAGAVASKTLGLAMKAIPLMFIIGLVATLITHWEDLVGWFEDTFPALKKMGGAMNTLKGVIVGVGKAVVHWLINPFETFAKVIKKIMAGDFSGAVEEAVNGVKNQFTGLGKAFKEGFQDQVERGMEDMSRKAAAEMDKTLTHQKNMITKQKNADGTYRKEYIEANKKMFANRKKMYKKDSDEYRKVLEDEAQFNQQVEDAKVSASKKASAERAKAAKAAADAEKKAQEETLKAIKEAEEEWKKYTDVRHEVGDAILDQQILQLKLEERLQKRKLESYASGPIETYMKELQKLYSIQEQIANLDQAKAINDISKSLADNIKYLNKDTEAWKRFEQAQYDEIKNKALEAGKSLEEAEKYAEISAANIENIWTQMFDQMLKMSDEERYVLLDSLGYNEKIQEELVNLSKARTEKEKAEVKKRLNILKTEQTKILNSWQKVNALILQSADENNAKFIDSQNQALTVMKSELDDYANDAERSYEWLMKRIKDINVEPVAKDNIWGKLFGVVDEKETLEKYERIKKMWIRAYNEIQDVIKKSEEKWDLYLRNVAAIYGQDSIQYKKAIQEKMDALEKLRKKALEVGKVANAPTSLKGDYNADGNADSGKPKRKLWYGKNDRKSDGSPYNLFDNVANLFNSLDETVLAPAMDTFSMFMDFAIEETAQRLEQVQELHDKALDKVNESADKIKELNEAIKDSGNDNMEATKQQLADEQLLYAQRLAEEKKLAEEERNLKNKQEQQQANARKMELRYQMVMAIANTAQGASKALAQWGWPLGAVFAGVMAALGAVQVALIAKQIGQIKPVKYAEGGLLSGPSHAQGGIKAMNGALELEGNEYVVNKKSTSKYINILERINSNDPSVRYLQGGSTQYADTKIRKFANGGLTPNFEEIDSNLRANNEANRVLSAIDNINFSPTVAVKDIWKAEDRLVRVRGLSGLENRN